MFGAIICPRCHRARGVSLSSKRVRCTHCGKSIDVSMAKVYHRTESEEELAMAVRKLSERMAERIEDYPAERKRRSPPSPVERRGALSEDDLRALARRLTEEGGDFSLQDLMAATGTSEKEAQGLLERMVTFALVFEPAHDRFKAL